MQQLLWILTQPDYLPIVAMVGALAFLLTVWWRQARRHDRIRRDAGAAGDAAEAGIGREMRR